MQRSYRGRRQTRAHPPKAAGQYPSATPAIPVAGWRGDKRLPLGGGAVLRATSPAIGPDPAKSGASRSSSTILVLGRKLHAYASHAPEPAGCSLIRPLIGRSPPNAPFAPPGGMPQPPWSKAQVPGRGEPSPISLQGVAGPHASMLLALHGADVIKIEPPEGGWGRALGEHQGRPPAPIRSPSTAASARSRSTSSRPTASPW